MKSLKGTLNISTADIIFATVLMYAGLLIFLNLDKISGAPSKIEDFAQNSGYLALLSSKPLIIVLAIIAISAVIAMYVLTKKNPENSF